MVAERHHCGQHAPEDASVMQSEDLSRVPPCLQILPPNLSSNQYYGDIEFGSGLLVSSHQAAREASMG